MPLILIAIGLLAVLLAIAVAVVRTSRLLRFSIGTLQAEFQKNGGSSLKDAVDRIEAKVDAHLSELVARVDEHQEQLADHDKRLGKLENPPRPRTPRKKAA